MKTKTPSRSGAYTIGRQGFARISEVEGIRTGTEIEQVFREFDRQGLSHEERRRILLQKFARKV